MCLIIFLLNYGVFGHMLTLIGHSVDGLVLSLGHVAEVGEDHKAREEAREAVDRRRDLEIVKKDLTNFASQSPTMTSL